MRLEGVPRQILAQVAPACALLAAVLLAEPARSEIGATSSASIRISVSVARRASLGVASLPDRDDAGAARQGLCIWSNAPLRLVTVTLKPLTPDSETGSVEARARAVPDVPLAPNRPIALVAEPSATACTDRRQVGVRALGRQIAIKGPALLILAPE